MHQYQHLNAQQHVLEILLLSLPILVFELLVVDLRRKQWWIVELLVELLVTPVMKVWH